MHFIIVLFVSNIDMVLILPMSANRFGMDSMGMMKSISDDSCG